jgi:hypothetical protein
VRFDRDGRRIFILRASASRRWPIRAAPVPGAGRETAAGHYIGGVMQGALTILDTPDAATLKDLTTRVYRITPYSDAHRLAPAKAPRDSPIPRRVGAPSPIRHVRQLLPRRRGEL